MSALTRDFDLGQLRLHLRGQIGLEAVGLNKVQGKPFHVAEVRSTIESLARRPGGSGAKAEGAAVAAPREDR